MFHKYEYEKIIYDNGSQIVKHASLGRHNHLLEETQGKYLYFILHFHVFIFHLTII